MFKMCKKLLSVSVLVMFLAAFMGLSFEAQAEGQGEQSKAEEKIYNLYIISHAGPGDPFWGSVIQGIDDAKALLGKDRVKVTFVSPQKHSVEKLLDFLDTALADNPDGIGMTMTDPAALEEAVTKVIKERGIPVIAFNSGDSRPIGERIPYLTYIGQSFWDAGEGLARRILEERTPTRAVVATHKPGTVFSRERSGGIMRVLEEKGVPVEKIDVTLDPTKGVEILSAYFTRYPDTDAVFTVGRMPTHYAIDFITERNLKGKVLLGGFDVDAKIVNAIKDGICLGTVDQQGYFQGYLTVHWLYLIAKYGFQPPPILNTGSAIIDKSNLDTLAKLINLAK